MRHFQVVCFVVGCLSAFLFFPFSSRASTPDDTYLTGYAAAILERDFHISRDAVRVSAGVITVRAESVPESAREKIMQALATIPGAVRVEMRAQGRELASAPATAPSPLTESVDQGRPDSALAETGFLPGGYLFDQLSADPRWPHFSVAYRYYLSDKQLASTGAANFGETISLYRDRAPFDGRWEFGLQAGVFSLFDLNAHSKDLINADYMGGVFASYRLENFSSLLRVFHQSSHLGDEFLLRSRENQRNRVNLSYEQVDLKLSYRFAQALRLYGGGGYLFDQEPSSLDPWRVQYGVEIESPWTLAGRSLRPIAAVDLQNEQESNWSTNISLRGGLQFENWVVSHRRLQLLVEYFKGYSPNGQFYTRKIETIGLGAHLRF